MEFVFKLGAFRFKVREKYFQSLKAKKPSIFFDIIFSHTKMATYFTATKHFFTLYLHHILFLLLFPVKEKANLERIRCGREKVVNQKPT